MCVWCFESGCELSPSQPGVVSSGYHVLSDNLIVLGCDVLDIDQVSGRAGAAKGSKRSVVSLRQRILCSEMPSLHPLCSNLQRFVRHPPYAPN